MNLYLDASALVKRYVEESGSRIVNDAIGAAESLATSMITRVEVSAALSRLSRSRPVDPLDARRTLQRFQEDWRQVYQLAVTERACLDAEDLAWSHGLRAYDSVQLAAALSWRDHGALPVTMATFDHQLWQAARATGLGCVPDDLPAWLEALNGAASFTATRCGNTSRATARTR